MTCGACSRRGPFYCRALRAWRWIFRRKPKASNLRAWRWIFRRKPKASNLRGVASGRAMRALALGFIGVSDQTMGIVDDVFGFGVVRDLSGNIVYTTDDMVKRRRQDAYRDLVCKYDARVAVRKFFPITP